MVAPVDYNALTRGIEISESHSAIEITGLELFCREGSLREYGKHF